jgi:hypothetical protein
LKINIAGGPKTLIGEQFKDQDDKPLEYRTLLTNAVLGSYQDEQNLSGEEKLKRWKIATRVHECDGLLHVDSKEVELLKTLAAKAYSTSITAQIWMLLEGDLEPPHELLKLANAKKAKE